MRENQRGKKYQLWEYSVSHGSLLIRSPKSEFQAFNHDIVFTGVQYISACRHMDNIEFSEVTRPEIESARAMLNSELEVEDIYIFMSDRGRHMIVASSMTAEQNDLDIFSPRFG